MFLRKYKSQTATEYLIITAVVIILALVVVSFLGDIPGLSQGITADDTVLAIQSIGISNYVISDGGAHFTLRNNGVNTKQILQLSVGDVICQPLETFTSSRVGSTQTVFCPNIRESTIGTRFTEQIIIVYRDLSNGVMYTQQGRNIAVSGRTASIAVENYIPAIDKSQSTLYQTGSWQNISDELRKFVFEEYSGATYLCRYGHTSNYNSKTFSVCDGDDGSQPFVHITMDEDISARPEISAHSQGMYFLEVKVEKDGRESQTLRHDFYMYPLRMNALCVNEFTQTDAQYFDIAKQFLRPSGVFSQATQLRAPYLRIDFSDGKTAVSMTFGKELKFNTQRDLILMKRVYAQGGNSKATSDTCRVFAPDLMCRDKFEFGDNLCQDNFDLLLCSGACPRNSDGEVILRSQRDAFFKTSTNSCDALVFNRDGRGVCIQGNQVIREVYTVVNDFYRGYLFTEKIRESWVNLDVDCPGTSTDTFGYRFCLDLEYSFIEQIEETYGLYIGSAPRILAE